MKMIGTMLGFCCLLTACFSHGNGGNGSEISATGTEVTAENEKAADFRPLELTYPGSDISFKVSVRDGQLTIQPSGLSVSDDAFVHDIVGYTVTDAEIGDLNLDGYPEVFVYLNSDGSGSYGKLIGYSVNNGKSASRVYLPPITEDANLSRGYMGHDEMAIVESTFCRRFPIYGESDSNGGPTGVIRQIQYKLTDGVNGRILKVDKVLEF